MIETGAKWLTQAEFDQSFDNVPRVAVNLFLKDDGGRVLLTRRKGEPHSGKWHFPGCFLLKGEPITDCLKRIAQKDLGLSLDHVQGAPAGFYEDLDGDPRGHVIDLVSAVQLDEGLTMTPTEDTMEIAFHSFIPPDMGFKQERILMELGYHYQTNMQADSPSYLEAQSTQI